MLKGRPFGSVIFMIKHVLRNSAELISCVDRRDVVIRVSNCIWI